MTVRSTPASPTSNRIDRVFRELRAAGRIALGPYLTAGYPSLAESRDIILGLLEHGATMVEIGLPFSDPLADGATIQRANLRALQNGVRMEQYLGLIRDLRSRTDAPLIPMGYVNPMLRYGLERFVAEAAEAGADGLIVPDVPIDEADELEGIADRHGVHLIHFVAPTSGDERIERVAKRARGFIYCVSLTGVTGARATLSDSLPDFLAKVRRHTAVPLMVGFGISRPEHVRRIAELADGAMIGAGLIDQIEKATSEPVGVASAYIASMRAAADEAVRPATPA